MFESQFLSTESNVFKRKVLVPENPKQHPKDVKSGLKLHEWDEPGWGEHRLAVVVPFRDRFDELQEFVPHMHQYLNQQHIRHKIYVINQADILRYHSLWYHNVPQNEHILLRKAIFYLILPHCPRRCILLPSHSSALELGEVC